MFYFQNAFDSKTQGVDLKGAYQFNENIRVTVGGRNIFDEYPEKTDRSVNGNDYCCGRVYQSSSIVDWQGG